MPAHWMQDRCGGMDCCPHHVRRLEPRQCSSHRRQLHILRKEDMSMAQYMNKMEALSDTMAAAGAPITDDELVDHIIVGLCLGFNSIAACSPLATSLCPIRTSTSTSCRLRRATFVPCTGPPVHVPTTLSPTFSDLC
jgi:hypothetical protein